MFSYDQAKIIVQNYLSNFEFSRIDDTFVVIEEQTIEKPFAWIFTYTSKQLFESIDVKFQIAGNSLVFVNKYSGKISTYSTAFDLDTLLVKYEEENLIWRLVIMDIDSLSQKQLLFLKRNLNLDLTQISRIITDKVQDLQCGSLNRLKELQENLLECDIRTEIMINVISSCP